MPEYADTATIGVFPASPSDEGFAHRIFRDLSDRKYQVFFEPEQKTTLTVIVSWTDAFGWAIQYHSKVRTETFRGLDHFYQSLRSDFLLANQPWVPPSMVRPF
jgi:hypothetical protein